MAGYAGVIIGATCLIAAAWWEFHTGSPSSASWGFVSMTGFGHLQLLNTRKNFRRSDAGHALGYNWSTSATAMLMFTPPQYPILFEYSPRFLAHFRTRRTTARKVWYRFSVPLTRAAMRLVTRGPLRLFSVAESTPLRTASSSMSKFGGTDGVFNRANRRSMLMPSQSNVRIGTAAFSTGTKFVTSGWRRMRSARLSGSRGGGPSSSSSIMLGGT
mmetsp:Transcript_50859/g.108361  ORF Transcript_50859/g.108361 Transcript_50859/m.108361 type:complete len:215 (-) Transcript_50859:171-815(-)